MESGSAQLDPRPALSPPAALLAKRDEVRTFLADTRRAIGEIAFHESGLPDLVEAYLSEFNQWIQSGNRSATWLDTIAVHVATINEQVGGFLPSSEPMAILMSPLHPLRLAWHCCAQKYLADALAQPCPAAGILDPSGCPDVGLWVLQQGSDLAVPRAFFSLPCEDPHWAVLLNRSYLGRMQIELVLARLFNLGLRTRGLPGGFTRSQANNSVEEVAKLVPGRATLRVGLVGDKEKSSACAEGVWSWCAEKYDEDTNPAIAPFNVEVFDMRGASDPTPEQLAILAEETSDRVKWFRVAQLPAESPQDLVLLDQLGADAPGGETGVSRTPTAPAALMRIRTREDSRNAMQLKESRIGRQELLSDGLPSTLTNSCINFENLALADIETSHLSFRPIQQAIGSRLTQATYVAVTSTQIDPACIIRGTRIQRGYLWDYELPGTLTGDEERAGYYLIASPTEAMLRAISQSAQLVASTPPPVTDLIDEISRRGIPILKRLAAGGSQSRGELGLLLAVRFLQDAFRTSSGTLGLPVWYGQCLHLVLAVDPYEDSFEMLRRSLRVQTTDQRPDLLVFAIHLPGLPNDRISIKITPVEVKFRQGQMPGSEMRDALEQASTLATLLDALWVRQSLSDLWSICSSGLLGQVLELAFRIYADPTVHRKTPEEWTRAQESVISAVLNQKADVTVNGGRLLVFDESAQSGTFDVNADTRLDTAVICRDDAAKLLTGSGILSVQVGQSIRLLDFSFPDCGSDEVTDQAVSGDTGRLAVDITAVPPSEPVVTEPEAPPSPSAADSEPIPTNSETQSVLVTGPRVPPEVREAVTQVFEGFIGNEAAVRRIRNDLLLALIERPPYLSKNFLFTGQPSTGKTEISRRMALALQLPFVKLDGRALRSRERLFDLIDGELAEQGLATSQVGSQAGLPVLQYPPLIVFIDEVHLVPRAIQESLLTMLEAADRSVLLPDRVARMNRATFLFATTRASDIDAAFRSRCTEIQLKEYTREQVAEMVRLRFPHSWRDTIYLTIAQLGRRVPRIALELARELETAITVAEDPTLTIDRHLDEVRRSRELDELGLTPMDLEYLSHLLRENRPVGEQTILNMMGTVDPHRVLNEIEPFLRTLGLIRFGPRGREITEEGKNYVVRRAPSS